MSTAVLMPREVELRLRRRGAAVRWRADHSADPDRDRLWRSYVTGALWRERLDRSARRAVFAGLVDAERMVPFSSVADFDTEPVARCAALVDLGQRCEQTAPCSVHDVDADPDPQPLPGATLVEPDQLDHVDGVDSGARLPDLPLTGPERRIPSARDEELRQRIEQPSQVVRH